MLFPDRSSSAPRENSHDEKIVLRSAGSQSEEDRDFVRAVAHHTFLSYGSYDEYLDGWLGSKDVTTIFAELEGRPAGFFMLTSYRDAEGSNEMVADLVAIAVAPEFQSRGVGKRLLAHACSLASAGEPPPREMWLVVAEGNARALRFFGRQGFRLGSGVGVYPGGQRALRMVKPLEVKS